MRMSSSLSGIRTSAFRSCSHKQHVAPTSTVSVVRCVAARSVPEFGPATRPRVCFPARRGVDSTRRTYLKQPLERARPVAALPTVALAATMAPPAQAAMWLLIAIGVLSAAAVCAVGYNTEQRAKVDELTGANEQVDAGEAGNERDKTDAVLVVGATGKLGSEVVAALLAAGRCVVAAGRQEDAAALAAALDEQGLQAGPAKAGDGFLHLAPGVDITRPDSLSAELFRGVTQIVAAVGPRFGKQSDGGMGFDKGSSPGEVDAEGVAALVAAAQANLPSVGTRRSFLEVLPIATQEDIERWRPLNDVIMGGQSSSGMEMLPDSEDGGAVWSGTVIVEGGGFCGLRTEPADLKLGGYDGIRLRVKGEGQRFKLNLKTEEQMDVPESTYQACFNTVDGEWMEVFLPWHEFRCVKRAAYDPSGPPLRPAHVRQVGLVYSRFEFNGLPNPFFTPGDFRLLLDGGVSGYKDPRPEFVLVSSAGVERNARIGDDEEARARDIPILRLNPGGILNAKYDGECALRASRVAYTVLRPTGLVQPQEAEDEESKGESGCRVLELSQGDVISGKISRAEVAQLVVAALMLPEAVGKTFEARRCEAADSVGREMHAEELKRLALRTHADWDRAKYGLPPFPRPVEYVSPPSVVDAESRAVEPAAAR